MGLKSVVNMTRLVFLFLLFLPYFTLCLIPGHRGSATVYNSKNLLNPISIISNFEYQYSVTYEFERKDLPDVLYQRILFAFNGPVNDTVLDVCGRLYIVGKFTRSSFTVLSSNPTPTPPQEYSNVAESTPVFAVNNPMPLLIANNYMDIDEFVDWNSQQSTAKLFKYVEFESGGYINSISTACGPLQRGEVEYCKLDCELYIGGKFTMTDHRYGTWMKNVAVWSPSKKSWTPIFKDTETALKYLEKGEIVSKVSKNPFGVFIATNRKLLLSTSSSNFTVVARFVEPAFVKEMIFYNRTSGRTGVYIIGNFQHESNLCNHLCQFENNTLFNPFSSVMTQEVTDIALDFHGNYETNLYFSVPDKVYKTSAEDISQQQIIIQQPVSDRINSIGLCYETSYGCKRESEFLVTVLESGTLNVFDSQIQLSKQVILPNETIFKLRSQDDLIPISVFNIPNGGSLSPGMNVSIYSDLDFPQQTTYQCLLGSSSVPAYRVSNTKLECVVQSSLNQPKNMAFLQIQNRVSAITNYPSNQIQYDRVLLFYDGQDRCSAAKYDLRLRLGNFAATGLLVIGLTSLLSLLCWVFVGICLLIPCKISKVTNLVHKNVAKLSTPVNFVEPGSLTLKQRHKTLLGGFVTLTLLCVYVAVLGFTTITEMDPFKTQNEQYLNTVSKTIQTFRMVYHLNRTSCTFGPQCKEFIAMEESISILNETDPLLGANQRNFAVTVDTPLYAEGEDYFLQMDQCCDHFELTPVPQLLKENLDTTDAFDKLDVYEQVTLMRYKEFKYTFDSFKNPLNRTSNIVISNRWQSLRSQSKESFLQVIEEALIIHKNPMCLFKDCHLQKKDSSAKSILVTEQCLELASGDNTTMIHFKLENESRVNNYSTLFSVITLLIKLVTLLGSLVSLRGIITLIVLTAEEKISKYLPLKSLGVFLLGTVAIYIPSVLFTMYSQNVFAEFGLDPNKLETMFLTDAWSTTLSVLGFVLSGYISGLVINCLCIWNGNFLSYFRYVEPFSLQFWRRALQEPFVKTFYMLKKFAAFRWIVSLMILTQITPLFFVQYACLAVIIILWKFLLVKSYYEKFPLEDRGNMYREDELLIAKVEGQSQQTNHSEEDNAYVENLVKTEPIEISSQIKATNEPWASQQNSQKRTQSLFISPVHRGSSIGEDSSLNRKMKTYSSNDFASEEELRKRLL